jgi:hypothetical protein
MGRKSRRDSVARGFSRAENTPPATPLWPRLALSAAAALFAIVVFEAALRVSSPTQFYVWPPGLEQTFHPDSTVMPGVSGTSHFRINSEGMRAEDPAPGDSDAVLTVGGSTTECLFLDDSEAWPHLLQTELSSSGKRVFVGNVGKSGHRTRQHILQVERLLPQYPRFKTIVLLAGLNDLQRALQGELDANTPIGPDDYMRAFMVYPGSAALPSDAPFYERTRIYALLKGLKRIEVPVVAPVQDYQGHFYQKFREMRHAAPRTPLPDLTIPLGVYRHDLLAVADAAKSQRARLVFATQPALWRADLPPDLEALTWFGWSRTNAYYSTPDLAGALNRYNAVLKDVCKERGLECVDLAAQLPKDTSIFYDDCHFNENGARTVAKILASAISH